MTSRPTATSFAILGLLGIQPWTAYELVLQSRRSLHWFWPRSEAHLYAELKRIVERGHAQAEVLEDRRQRTRYTITPEGRLALRDWLKTEPQPAILEIEGMLRLLLADQGSKDDLRAALQATARQTRDTRAAQLPLVAQLLTTGGHFPQRGHLTERLIAFFDEFNRLLIGWCDETLPRSTPGQTPTTSGSPAAHANDSNRWSPTGISDANRRVGWEVFAATAPGSRAQRHGGAKTGPF